jgi:predicted secreted protein
MTNHPRAWGSLALTALLTLTLLAACGLGPKEKPVVAPSLIQSPEKKLITVSELNDNAHIILEAAQVLIVRLPIDAIPGREWSLVDLKPGVLTASAPKFERVSMVVNEGDATGTIVWHFTPEAAGTVALKFELRRPRSLDAAVQAVNYTVTVK